MKTNIKTMTCLCHNRLNTYPFLPHSFSKLHPSFWKSKSQYHLSATSIKERAVMQEISGLNHTRFISYRRADRKPTNKPLWSQNPSLAEHHTLSQPSLQKQHHSTSGMQGFTASQSWQRKWLLREAIYTAHSQNTPSGMLKKVLSEWR